MIYLFIYSTGFTATVFPTQMVTNPKNTISGFRNLLGRGFSDPVTQDEIRNVPFTVEELKDKTVGFRVSCASK